MPVCIILVWVLASTGLVNIDKEKKRKLMIAITGVMVTCSLVMLHLQISYHYNFLSLWKHSNGSSQFTIAINKTGSELPLPIRSLSNDSLRPVTHIAYIKTHKTGSSTIWSIIVNFALKYKLTIALPAAKRGNQLGWPKSFSETDATPPKPDVLCHHSRFSNAMLQYMPKDTIYLTSLRDPPDQLRSAYTYFSAEKCLNMTFGQFISNPDKYETINKLCSSDYKWWLTNGQLFDLGLDTSEMSSSSPKDRDLVLNKIKELDKKLAVVLILERFDESLILMRDVLNWTTADIIYLKNNLQIIRPNAKPSSPYTNLQKSLAREWNWADQLLYLHFRNKIDSLIKGNAKYYKKEVKELQQLMTMWRTKCVKKVMPAAASDTNFKSNTYLDEIRTYTLTAKGKQIDKCVQLAMSEVAKNNLLINGKPVNSSKSFLKGKH